MGKNIILLSDGTGNSAGKLFKTNVWRLFQALDYAGRALELMPERTIFHFTQAKILHALGRADDAAVILRALRDQIPENRDIEQMLKDL